MASPPHALSLGHRPARRSAVMASPIDHEQIDDDVIDLDLTQDPVDHGGLPARRSQRTRTLGALASPAHLTTLAESWERLASEHANNTGLGPETDR